MTVTSPLLFLKLLHTVQTSIPSHNNYKKQPKVINDMGLTGKFHYKM